MAQKRFTTISTIADRETADLQIAVARSAIRNPPSRNSSTTHQFTASVFTGRFLRLAGRLERQRLDVVDDLPDFLLA